MIRSLFFTCYYAYLLGNFEKSQMFYSLLREEFSTQGKPDSLERYQILELKRVKEALTTGRISRNEWLDEVPTTMPSSSPDVTIKQPELVKRIHSEGFKQLKEILQDDIYLYNIEHPCGSYGAVDMVYMGNDTVYPVEVKRGCGEHDLIGQIGKYDLHHKLQLHYRHYGQVKPVTICNSYNSFTINELRTMGVTALKYTLNKNSIFISD